MPNKHSKTDKILKLRNAICEYRGICDFNSKKWKRPPNHGAYKRVRRWAFQLFGLCYLDEIKVIDGFKTFDDMNEWLKKVTS